MSTGLVTIKVCGVTCVEDADAALAAGASAIGLNFVPSSVRRIDVDVARAIADHVRKRAIVVGVVANESVGVLRDLIERARIDCVQLHGDEPPEAVAALLPHAYKAVRIATAEDADAAAIYPGDYLLADAKVPGMLGGTGLPFDWSLVGALAKSRKLVLAGGLTPQNVARAISEVEPFCVDVASGVERDGDPRRKDPDKLSAFARAVTEAVRR